MTHHQTEQGARVDCPTCHGEGEVTFNPGYPDPQTETSGPCHTCHGEGTIDPAEEHDDC